MSDVICKECGHKYVGHDNRFGKICMHCGAFIEAEKELEVVIDNRKKISKLKKEVLDKLRRKFNGDINGN